MSYKDTAASSTDTFRKIETPPVRASSARMSPRQSRYMNIPHRNKFALVINVLQVRNFHKILMSVWLEVSVERLCFRAEKWPRRCVSVVMILMGSLWIIFCYDGGDPRKIGAVKVFGGERSRRRCVIDITIEHFCRRQSIRAEVGKCRVRNARRSIFRYIRN